MLKYFIDIFKIFFNFELYSLIFVILTALALYYQNQAENNFH